METFFNLFLEVSRIKKKIEQFKFKLEKIIGIQLILINLFSDLQQEGTCIIWPKTIPLRQGGFPKMQRFYRKIRDDHSRKVPSIYYVSTSKGVKNAKRVSKKCPKVSRVSKTAKSKESQRSIQKSPRVPESVQMCSRVDFLK